MSTLKFRVNVTYSIFQAYSILSLLVESRDAHRLASLVQSSKSFAPINFFLLLFRIGKLYSSDKGLFATSLFQPFIEPSVRNFKPVPRAHLGLLKAELFGLNNETKSLDPK